MTLPRFSRARPFVSCMEKPTSQLQPVGITVYTGARSRGNTSKAKRYFGKTGGEKWECEKELSTFWSPATPNSVAFTPRICTLRQWTQKSTAQIATGRRTSKSNILQKNARRHENERIIIKKFLFNKEMNTIPGIEVSNMKFRFTRIILNSALTALSFTQALAWKNAIDKLFSLFFPEDTDALYLPSSLLLLSRQLAWDSRGSPPGV